MVPSFIRTVLDLERMWHRIIMAALEALPCFEVSQ
jgi:hypothetical protein